ncbi:MAG: hypothetical protein WCK59_03270 [Candidatus Falkowbacteria bacterium]
MANENVAKKIEQIILTPKVEVIVGGAAEKKPENKVEAVSPDKNPEKESLVAKEKNVNASPGSSVAVVADDYHVKREQEIEAYLSDGLNETFLAMSPAKQKEFKEEGEKTAKKINILLDAAKININKIVKLIRHWLSLIAGVNRFFLDQETKIKADKIVKMKNKF